MSKTELEWEQDYKLQGELLKSAQATVQLAFEGNLKLKKELDIALVDTENAKKNSIMQQEITRNNILQSTETTRGLEAEIISLQEKLKTYEK